jgi:hypothetical protein
MTTNYKKIGTTMSLKRWYNNGEISKMFVPGQELVGFYPGRISWKTVKEQKHGWMA